MSEEFHLVKESTLLKPIGARLAIEKMAREITIKFGDQLDKIILVGIERRGVPIAERIAAFIQVTTGVTLPIGTAKTKLYTDDLAYVSNVVNKTPLVSELSLPCPGDGMIIILVDDVLYTGRSIFFTTYRVLTSCVPLMLQTAVLVDRGWRELSTHAEFVGLKVDTDANQVVHVNVPGIDEGFDELCADMMKKVAGRQEAVA